MNAQYFNLDNFDELVEAYGRNEMWRINEKFLDNQIASGRNIVFSNNPNKATANSYFRREVDYLIDRGYSFEKKGRYWHAYKAE